MKLHKLLSYKIDSYYGKPKCSIYHRQFFLIYPTIFIMNLLQCQLNFIVLISKRKVPNLILLIK